MAPILVWEPSRAELRKVADNRVGRQETLPIQQTLEVLVEKKEMLDQKKKRKTRSFVLRSTNDGQTAAEAKSATVTTTSSALN